MAKRPFISMSALAIALLGVAALRLLVGPEGLDPPRDTLEWSLRIGRVLSGAAVGGALGAAGVMLQALLRNPLAAPAVLGLTAGAGFGVTLVTFLGFSTAGAIAGQSATGLGALLGAIAVLVIVYSLAQRRGVIEPVTLILVGVVVSMICAAGTVLLQHLMPERGLVATMRWLFGSLRDDAPRLATYSVLALTSLCVIVGAKLGPAMDAASLDDDEARSVGVSLHRLRLVLLSLAGALTAGSVVIAGPIGFVGLICPHAVRYVVGPSHRTLVAGSTLLGATVIIGADALIRVIDLGAGRMPIGVLTALVGGPAFIWLLRSRWVTP